LVNRGVDQNLSTEPTSCPVLSLYHAHTEPRRAQQGSKVDKYQSDKSSKS
jgi:hypothetical protein